MRRTHLRGHVNILKRLLIHVAGFNLGLVMRAICGIGKPRRMQDGLAAAILCLFHTLWRAFKRLWSRLGRFRRLPTAPDPRPALPAAA